MIVADAVVNFFVVFTLMGIGCCVVTLAHYSQPALHSGVRRPAELQSSVGFSHVLYFDKNVLTHFVRKTC